MISCIICSRREQQLTDVKQNIAETIGIAFEVIAIDNSSNKYSICEAYNIGAGKAAFDYFCFVHEDLIFKTPDWGQLLLNHFKSLDNPGVLGIAGSSYKSLAPSGYWSARSYKSYNYIESDSAHHPEPKHKIQNAGSISRMITLDGVFLAVKKQVYLENKFDEAIRNFHGYDLDFTISITKKFNNYFIPDILIHHFSGGHLNEAWIENIYQLHKKWQADLPMTISSTGMDDQLEQAILGDFAGLVLTSKLSASKKNLFIISSMNVLATRQKSLMPCLVVAKAYAASAFRVIRQTLKPQSQSIEILAYSIHD